MINRMILIVCLLLMMGCFSPTHYQVEVYVPEDWKEQEVDRQSVCDVGGWWKQLNDPVLDDLIEQTLMNNNDLQVAISRVEQFAAQYAIVRSALFPQISFDASFLRQEISLLSSPVAGVGNRTSDLFTLLGMVSYEVDVWGRIRSAAFASFEDLNAQIEAQRTVLITVVAATASSYLLLREFDAQHEIAQKTLKSRRESFDIAKARFEEGLTSELEVKQSQSVVESAAAEVIRLSDLIIREENLLSILIGEYPNKISRGKSIDDFFPPLVIPIGLPGDLLCQRPDIRQAEYVLSAANARVDEARAAFFPQITLTGNYGYESMEFNQLLSDKAKTWQYEVDALQPIFTGGRLSAQVCLAQAKKQEAYFLYIQVILGAFREIENALSTYRYSLELKEVQAQRVQVLKDYYTLAHLQYDNGQADYLNVLDAERTLFSAQLDLVQAQANVFLSLVGIYKALGGDWLQCSSF